MQDEISCVLNVAERTVTVPCSASGREKAFAVHHTLGMESTQVCALCQLRAINVPL